MGHLTIQGKLGAIETLRINSYHLGWSQRAQYFWRCLFEHLRLDNGILNPQSPAFVD